MRNEVVIKSRFFYFLPLKSAITLGMQEGLAKAWIKAIKGRYTFSFQGGKGPRPPWSGAIFSLWEFHLKPVFVKGQFCPRELLKWTEIVSLKKKIKIGISLRKTTSFLKITNVMLVLLSFSPLWQIISSCMPMKIDPQELCEGRLMQENIFLWPESFFPTRQKS